MKKLTVLLVVFVLLLAACTPQPAAPAAEEPAAEEPAAEEPAAEEPMAEEPAAEEPMEEEPMAEEPVTIEFWHSLSGDFGAVLEQLIVDYNESQDKVVVNAVYQGNYQDTQKALLAALAADDAPDAAQLEASFGATLAAKGVLTPVEDFTADPDVGLTGEEFDAIYPGFKAATSIDGTMYTMPFNTSMPVLYYNADMLADLELAPPETWDDFKATCNEVTNADKFGFTINAGNVWVFEAMVWQNEGMLFSEDGTQSLINEPAAVEALQFWVDMVESGCAKAQAWEEGRTEFFNGNVAFLEDSSGSLGGILNNIDFELGVTHIPWGKQKVATIGGATLGMFADSDVHAQAAAWDFIKFLTSPASISRLSADTGYLPATSLALDMDPLMSLLEEDPMRASILELLPYAAPRPMVEGYPEIQGAIRQAIEEATLQQKTAQEALDVVAEEANRILSE
jgi:sn-glycerol 3-phosphate transport system substrate-binding protein